jgi:FkbM family methyltransferase
MFPKIYYDTPRHLDKIKKFDFVRPLMSLPCLEIVVDGKTIRFSFAPGSKISFDRVATIFSKEPTTIPYLETFEKDDVFLDVGANVGMYSIYASVMTGCKTYCMEPESLNYAELNKNIHVNELGDRVIAYCAAASNEFKIDRLLLGAFAAGYSHHDFGESTWLGDMRWTKDYSMDQHQRSAQGSISVTIDQMVQSGAILQPNHTKIDVDGHEPKVIEGAKSTLCSPALKTVLVEVDFRKPSCQNIIDYMEGLGWKYSLDQLVTNRTHVMKRERVSELRSIKKDGFNYIFYKDPAYGQYFSDFLSRYTPPLEKSGGVIRAPAVVE